MRPPRFSVQSLPILTLVTFLSLGLTTVTVAQSQEPKPELPATPISQPGTPAAAEAATGVSGSSWQGPNFGVRVHWDPNVWTVEGGVEYVECRTVFPGQTVLEITWQAVTQAFNQDFANVEELLAAVELPEGPPPATPEAPGATPVA